VPKVAANFRPVEWFSLRGSYSKAFQAPTLANGSASLIGTNVVNVTDPVDGTTSFRTIQTYGNPNLKPQSSTVYNIGATFVPTRRARFRSITGTISSTTRFRRRTRSRWSTPRPTAVQ
jgi:iron complex outermembrane receptor protein